jgi:hypothetical protein
MVDESSYLRSGIDEKQKPEYRQASALPAALSHVSKKPGQLAGLFVFQILIEQRLLQPLLSGV